MSDSLTVIAPKTLEEANQFATTIAGANALPAALKKSPADILAIVLAGAELGIPPMSAIRSMHLIEGKPVLSADAMAGLCLRQKDVCEYLTVVTTTETKATYRTKRRGAPEPVEMSFTIEQAKAAGLVGKGTWAKFPAAMLRARAVSALARAVYPDLVGNLYDPDEMRFEREISPAGMVIDAQAAVASAREAVKKARAEKIVEPVPLGPEDEATVGWGKNAALKLAELDDEKVKWYRDDAEKKALANEDDERDLWVSRYARYCEVLKSRKVEV